MNAEEKIAFRAAAEEAWKIWAENDAVEILTQSESKEVLARLAPDKQNYKILAPRYVFTDKHDPLRTSTNPLPLKARARIVLPGYKDITSFTVRKDAPTGSRVSQDFLLSYTASRSSRRVGKKKAWR